jgi:ribosomal protein S18 acetylase RimI-like enzyme
MVCEMDREIAGYIVVGIKIPSLFERLEMRTKALFGQPVELEVRKGHIMNIAVDPQKRGRGLGATLLQHGLNYLQELDGQTAELEVRVSNFTAIRLYERFGFQIEKRIYQYYHDGEDGYMMFKTLQSTSAQSASES